MLWWIATLRDTSVSAGSRINPSPSLRNRAGFDTRIVSSACIPCCFPPALTKLLIGTRFSGFRMSRYQTLIRLLASSTIEPSLRKWKRHALLRGTPAAIG